MSRRAWLTPLIRAVIGRPLELPPGMVRDFPVLSDAAWRVGGIFPRIGGWCLGQRTVAAITLGETVFLATEQPGARLLLHELAHIRQYRRDRMFFIRYLWESVRRGYAGNRYEAAADQFAEEALWSGTPRRPS